jgi:hypothetical protein
MTCKTCRLIAIVQCYSAELRDRLDVSEAGRSYDSTGRGYAVDHAPRGRSTRWGAPGTARYFIT